MNRYENLTKRYNELKCDEERWAWIREHQHSGVLVMLDNDDTYGIFEGVEWVESEEQVLQLDGYIGTGPGISALLSFVGINHEEV